MALFNYVFALVFIFLAACYGQNNTYQLEQDVCQIYTRIETPVVVSTFVSSNTVLTFSDGCTLTVDNAPTTLFTTVTLTSTLTNDNASPNITIIPAVSTQPTTTSSLPSTSCSFVPAPTSTPGGSTNSCCQWYVVQQGDTCPSIESAFDITFDQFQALNPSIDDLCDYLLVAEAYCVSGIPGPLPTNSMACQTTGALSAVLALSTPTPYCSSLLSISPVVLTTTQPILVTPSAGMYVDIITPAIVNVTTTTYVTIISQDIIYNTTYSPDILSINALSATLIHKFKRGEDPLNSFPPGDLSSACSCLSLTTDTTTTTFSTTSFLATPTNVITSFLPTSTQTIVITSQVTDITTVIEPDDILPACNNPSYFGGFNFCGGGCDGVCFGDSNGQGWCAFEGDCDQECTLNSDCGSGICLINTGCGNTCYEPEYIAFCEPQYSGKKLFRKNVPGGNIRDPRT